ncbi:unnamed protein product [Lampetra fluviatilis]
MGAQMVIYREQQPFIQILNVRPDASVIQAGTVLAHESTMKENGNIVGGVRVASATDQGQVGKDSWVDALCSENLALSDAQRTGVRDALEVAGCSCSGYSA